VGGEQRKRLGWDASSVGSPSVTAVGRRSRPSGIDGRSGSSVPAGAIWWQEFAAWRRRSAAGGKSKRGGIGIARYWPNGQIPRPWVQKHDLRANSWIHEPFSAWRRALRGLDRLLEAAPSTHRDARILGPTGRAIRRSTSEFFGVIRPVRGGVSAVG
jgi:hypothetical protein